jgi:hypothetical protein
MSTHRAKVMGEIGWTTRVLREGSKMDPRPLVESVAPGGL